MGRDQEIRIKFSQAELEQLNLAIEVIGIEITSFIRNAALLAAGQVKKRPYTKYELNTIFKEGASRGHKWSETELREKQLPLYWCEEWVRAQLANGVSAKQLAILTSSHKSSVTSHLQQQYGISAYRTLTQADIDSIRQRFLAGEPRRQISLDFGISNVTVGKYLKGLPTHLEKVDREARKSFGQVVDESPLQVLPPNAKGLRHWSERLFEERIQLIEQWPTSTAVIANRVFSGNRDVAKDWTQKMVKAGRLVRLTRGWFDLKKTDSGELVRDQEPI